MPAKHLSRSLADRHEALYPRFEALAAQAAAIAARRPGAAVPAAMRSAAETLFYDVQAFLPSRRGLRAVPPDMGGLAIQLGQGLAALDVYEAANTAWHPDLKCRVWSLGGNPLPVRRLRPEGAALIRSDKEKRYFDGIRERLLNRFDMKADRAYEQGYEDAKLNKPMREPKVRSEFDKRKI